MRFGLFPVTDKFIQLLINSSIQNEKRALSSIHESERITHPTHHNHPKIPKMSLVSLPNSTINLETVMAHHRQSCFTGISVIVVLH